MMNWLLVMLGGAIGTGLRYGLSLWVPAPLGILVINVMGCFVMGVLAGYGAHMGVFGQPARLFLLVGVLGGYTTFSSFGLDTLLLVERGQWLQAGLYVAGSVILSLLSVFAGLWLVKAWL